MGGAQGLAEVPLARTPPSGVDPTDPDPTGPGGMTQPPPLLPAPKTAQRLVWAAKQPLGNAALGALFA